MLPSWSLTKGGVFQRVCVCVCVCVFVVPQPGVVEVLLREGWQWLVVAVLCLACGVDCATFVLSIVLRKTKSRSPTPVSNIPPSQHSHSSPK